MKKDVTIIALGIVLCLSAGMAIGAVSAIKYMDCNKPIEIKEAPKYRDLTGWELLTLAIIKTESEFRSDAIGKHKDLGCMQITPPYVREVNKIIDTVRFVHTDAFDIRKSLVMFSIYQEAKNPEHDIEKAISLHNPNGDAIGYTEKVLTNFRYLTRYEEVRKEVVR